MAVTLFYSLYLQCTACDCPFCTLKLFSQVRDKAYRYMRCPLAGLYYFYICVVFMYNRYPFLLNLYCVLIFSKISLDMIKLLLYHEHSSKTFLINRTKSCLFLCMNASDHMNIWAFHISHRDTHCENPY